MERLIFGSTSEVDIQGPPLQVFLNAGTVAPAGSLAISLTGSTIAASGTLNSAVFPTYGMPNVAIGATFSLTGTLSFQRYIDNAGSIAQGAAITQALTAATAGVLNNNDGKPFASAKLSIINGGTATGTLSAFGGMLQSR